MEAIRQGDIPGVQLRRRVEIAGRSPREVWSHVTEAERLSSWLADRARIEAGPPVVWRLESDLSEGTIRHEYAEIVERIEPSRLVLGFRELNAGWDTATRLTIELAPSAAGCEVAVFQEGFQQLPLSLGLTVWEHSRSRWEQSLERLAGVAGVSTSTTGP